MPEITKKIIIFLIISGLCVSAFFIRFENFKNPVPRTIDEMVYYNMARQMDDNIFAYNSAAYGLRNFMTVKAHYPDYFFKPVFKHPPLLTLLIMASVKVFGPTSLGAGFFPIFFGALAIALVYLLGSLIGGRAVGLLAAGFMWIDPVAIMSSQKIWPDTPLMFFMLLTVYGYWKAVKDKKDIFFLLGGLAAGAAFMIKYPGLLTLFGAVFFILFCYPRTFKNKYFITSLALPAALSLPWFLWNFYVYGSGMISEVLSVHGFSNIMSSKSLFVISVMVGIFSLVWIAIKNPDELTSRFKRMFSLKLAKILAWVGFFGTLVFLCFEVGRSIGFGHFPEVSWAQGFFSGEPQWFYFKRLLEFSFLYGFAYLAFFDPFSQKDSGRFLMKLSAFFIMFFYIVWGNFQCRYILPALPFLMILASDYIWKLLGSFARINLVSLRLLLQSVILILIALAISKTNAYQL